MLVHIKELHLNSESDDWDYDNAKFLAAHKIKNIDTFVKFIQVLKKHRKDILIGDEWYTVEDYALCFPTDHESLPCLYVYVIGY